ncbi:hypothetical protein [uncultured Algibacter sp.]|uniref:hypothetical protein n=1 Tax=uncultured Algibacter sp. TaxID=298659 RepID=UPI00262B77CE|nr:hypothetical protein [uncultured Algibacter sp.]
MNNLEVITITKHKLEDAILNNTFWNGKMDAPFSKNKAKWMLKNDRANADDTLAVFAYDGKKIIALVYLVPDLITTNNNLTKKVFWSQRWWVADKYKDTVLSTYIKKLSLNASKNNVLVKFLGDNTKAYYKKQPFTEFSKRKRYIIIFSLDYELLIYKKESLKKAASLIKLADRFSRKIIAKLNRSKTKINKSLINYKSVSHLNDELWDFLNKHCVNDIVPKDKAYINWQIDNNQYHVINNKEDKLGYKCLLGSISDKMYNSNLVVKNNDEIIGFISGFISNNRFIVRYFISDKNFYSECAKVLIRAVIDTECTILQTENTVLGEYVMSNFHKVYADVKPLVSLIHNDIDVDMNNAMMTDQDGNFF